MRRILPALVAALLTASVAVADIPPPPPPKGKKYVTVNNEVVLAKDVSGYVFVKQVSSFPGGRKPTFTKVELKSDKPTAIPEPARRTFVTLFAVPQDAAKEFKTDDELFDAIAAKKVKGAVSIGFGSQATVSDKVEGNSVKWTTTITAIGEKGITKKIEGEGYEPPADKPKPGGGEDTADEAAPASEPVASAPRGGLWVAGIAAFAAIMLSGFWLAGRTRRKV